MPAAALDQGIHRTVQTHGAQSGEAAQRKAHAATDKHGGAIAFSRTGDPNTGDFSDAEILATYGEVDKGMLGE